MVCKMISCCCLLCLFLVIGVWWLCLLIWGFVVMDLFW